MSPKCVLTNSFLKDLKQIFQNNFDIAAITETWLNDNITDNAVHVDSYHLVDVNFSFQNSLELLCCRLKVCSTSCLVIIVYRPPHCPLNDCIQNLDNILSFFTPQ
nr:unnamed protein product [Callosobruchus chinensis]